MSNYFIYSILQYKHNLALGEYLNVGILFCFPEDNTFEFVSGDATRAKAIYPDFNNPLFNSYFKAIDNKLKKHIDLFSGLPKSSDFASYIHKNILAEDAAGLIFREPVQVKNVFGNKSIAVEEYSKILLPGINTSKPKIEKHNDSYIIKTLSYFLGQNKSIEDKISKNVSLKTDHFNIKFDLSWKNSTKNYLKPISFDYSNESDIQNKAAIFYSYITELNNLNSSKKYRFDFLIAKPQDSSFLSAYDNAVDLLDRVKCNKQLIIEDQIINYSQEVISELLH